MKIAHWAMFQKMSLLRITPIKFLKLFILLSLSSELPATNSTRNRSPHADRWSSSFVSAWSLQPETKTPANNTEARDEIRISASNSSIGGVAEASNISIVRSGIQSSEATSGAATASSLSDVINLKKLAPEARQDVINQSADVQTTTSSTSQTVAENHRHHGGHSNHKNYPNEPYPSASYTTLSVHNSPSTTFTGNSNSSPNSVSGSHTLMSDREHHNLLDTQAYRLQQASPSDQVLNGYTGLQSQNSYQSLFDNTNEPTSAHMSGAPMRNGLSGSYDENALNQALVSLASAAAMPSVTFNDHNQIYPSQPAPLNASLIQNLTAGLFPIGKLSNVTMLSLSELLSKAKQATDQQESSLDNRPNDFDPFNYVTGTTFKGNQQTSSRSNNLAPASHQANYLEALLGDSRFNTMLDLLASKPIKTSTQPSQFGYRDQNAVARYQMLSSGPSHRNIQQNAHLPSQGPSSRAPMKDDKFDSAQIIMGTHAHGANQHLSKPSNVHNTYLPFKDNVKSQNKPITNGQMLNMAASLYDNYLDQNYRYPLLAKQQQQQQQLPQNVKEPANDYLPSNNNQYQFIQHHNSQNQNHIDKIIYHSTPFRPSIVSPPQQQLNGALMNTANSTQQGNHRSYQRPKTEADSKSMSYATLGNNNNQVVAGNLRPQPSFETNSSQTHPIRHHENDLDAIFDHIDGQHSGDKHQMNQTASSNKQQTQLGYNSTAAPGSNSNLKQPLGSSTLQQAPSGTGPQLLLDLYERTIDNQILEAIYNDHREHFQHLGPSASAGSVPTLASNNPQTSASVNSQSNWPFDENLVAPFQTTQPIYTMNSPGARMPSPSGPVALGHQSADDQYALNVGTSTGGYGPNTVVASTSIAQSSLVDPLASALQELPTFSASDLQTLLPTPSDANSLLMSPTQDAHSTPPLNFNPFTTLPNSQSETINENTHDASSLSPLTAQFFSPLAFSVSAGSPTPTNYNQLLGDNEVATSSYMFDSQLPSPAQPHANQLTQPANSNEGNQNSNASNNLGLPALLVKLQTGQLASILTSPFAHLYANLPRYRYSKSKQSGATTRQRNQNASQQASANSKIHNKQKAAAAMTPVDTSSGLQQPTLGQQASSLALSSLASGLTGGGVSPQVWRHILAPVNWTRKQTTIGQPNGTANGNSLSGLLPTVQQNSYGSQSPNQAVKSPIYHSPNQHSLPLALVNTIWNSSASSSTNNNNNYYKNQIPFNHLLSASQTQLSSTPLVVPTSSDNESQKRPPTRLGIKILKIPVAFYDTSSPTSSSSGESSVLQNEASTPSISLMPLHLQPGPTASLLASLSCPLHANHQQTKSFFKTNTQPTLSASTSIYSMPLPSGTPKHSHLNHQIPYRWVNLSQTPYRYQKTDQMESLFGGNKPASSGEQASLAHNGASQSTANTRTTGGKITPIRDFTDINQPNDLQVSPSGASDKPSMSFNQQQQSTNKSS